MSTRIIREFDEPLGRDAWHVTRVSDNGGELHCSCDSWRKAQGPRGTGMCKHVKEVLVKEDDRGLYGTINVPVYEKPKLVAEVKVDSADEFGLHSVWLKTPAGPQGRVHLGFINVHQGRMAVRRLLLDWLMAAPKVECSSPHHTTYGKTDREYHADVLSVLSTSWCWNCELNSGIPDV